MIRFRRSSVVAAVAVGLCITQASSLQGQRAGVIDVEFTDWNVPTPNGHPHDPAFGTDGSLWYTGQRANNLGRVDMATGQIREWPLPTANSGPHGLVSDRDGNIWYTGNSAGLVGKLDSKTGKVTEYKMPDPAARDPHTPIFDRNGTLWFTVQGGGYVGRIDPKNGEVRLAASAAGGRPYGIVISSSGTPVFDLFGTNKIGTIDPKTMAISRVRPAGRRPAAAYCHRQERHRLVYGLRARLPRPARSEDEGSQGMGVARRAEGAAVRHHDHGRRGRLVQRIGDRAEHARTVRPADRSFQKWTIPNGGGVVRHMVTAPNGELLLAYSGVNKVGRVRIKKTT